jgi:hypothetical protein
VALDITVSPDLPAYYCYLLVLLLGLWSAGAQVSKRLGNLPGKWIMVNTWSLFFAYTGIPLALFWLLDRTNAIHDTSLFAAILVGVGYQQILSGSLSTIKAPGNTSSFLKPFEAWAAAIFIQIRDRVAINDGQFDEKLLSSIVKDQVKFDALKQVVMVHTADPVALDTALAAIAANKPILGDAGVLTKQAAALYMAAKQASPQQFQYLLHKSDVIPLRWYLWYAKEWRSKVTAIAVAFVLLCAAAACEIRLNTPTNQASYFVWRLHKENGTEIDRYRARRELGQYLATDSEVSAKLTALLATPGLPVATADNILSLLIETRDRATGPSRRLLSLLAEALRANNSDVRERIQKTLVYLAADRQLTVPAELQNWNSDAKNTAADLDTVIKQWRTVVQ